jgi:hypothetical protein
MNKKETIKKYRKQIATYFDSRCYVCHKKYGKNFKFHHLTYRVDEKTYRDFKNSNDYQLYILPIIEKRVLDFELLCDSHHYMVEKLKLFKCGKLSRLFDIVLRSKK